LGKKVWSSSKAGPNKSTYKTDRNSFGNAAADLLEKHNNILPEQHRCSDKRHKEGGKFQKDATLAALAIFNW